MINLKTTGLAAVLLASTTAGALAEIQFALSTSQNATDPLAIAMEAAATRIEERTGGDWKPSAGSVYPTLQLLADEGLVVAEETDGRKVYSLTDTGRAAAGVDPSDPWSAPRSSGDRRTALPKAGIELARATAQVGRTGTAAQIDEAVAALDEARRRIYSILARD